ncbi:MAG TPA: alpha/beta fold hydrolase [Kofleriaceae bacterium]
MRADPERPDSSPGETGGEPPRFVEVAGGRFAYLAAGPENGPLVVCLHGFPDHAESFAPFLARLGDAGYRAVAPWMRGYAPSTLAGPYGGEQLADDALAIARAMASGRRFALIGHDWGALAVWSIVLGLGVGAAPRAASASRSRAPRLAFARGARAPDDLACAVTMAVPHPVATARHLVRHPSQLRKSWYVFFFQMPRAPEWALARGDFALVDRLWRDWSPGFALADGPRERLHRCLAASMPAPIDYYRAIPRQLGTLRVARGRIATPVLHLHGADDGCIEAAAAERQARFMKGPFASELVAEAGHFLHLERPDESSARTLRWLRAHHV